jgi:V-type H+-transporting ATPase subunit A
MLRNIVKFHDLSTAAIKRAAAAAAEGGGGGGGGGGAKITFAVVKSRTSDLRRRLASQKFEDPADGEARVVAKLAELGDDLVSSFRQLEDEFR